MHDKQDKAGIWMIDFAKTLHIEGRSLTHRTPWVVGNHEDGYLTGLGCLTEVSTKYSCRYQCPQRPHFSHVNIKFDAIAEFLHTHIMLHNFETLIYSESSFEVLMKTKV